MKQLYRPLNCLSDVADANARTNKQFSFFNHVHKILCLLLGILLLVPMLSFGKDKKPFFDWADDAGYWTVTYNKDTGSIDIHLLYYDHKTAGEEDGWLKA
ncbi:MAG TPA: hypothetical protein VI385_14875, partial [Flavisolibacter sp.]